MTAPLTYLKFLSYKKKKSGKVEREVTALVRQGIGVNWLGSQAELKVGNKQKTKKNKQSAAKSAYDRIAEKAEDGNFRTNY